MTREESISLSARISAEIARSAPKITYTLDELAEAKACFGEEDFAEMRSLGLYDGDFEKFYVFREFLSELDLGVDLDGDYILRIFEEARKLDAKEFCDDPYMAILSSSPARQGDCMLMPSVYEAGEIFCYDAPNFKREIVVPRLAFFTKRVVFPTLYEGKTPWMSVCPSEINSMREAIDAARGKVLVLGLGLGYYAHAVSQKPEVESVTVVELSSDVIGLFDKAIAPRLDFKGKLSIVEGDAIDYLATLSEGDYDFCFADIWEGAVDGAEWYKKILPHERRLRTTEFAYWIEDGILAYLG